jgi:hypothetical protein
MAGTVFQIAPIHCVTTISLKNENENGQIVRSDYRSLALRPTVAGTMIAAKSIGCVRTPKRSPNAKARTLPTRGLVARVQHAAGLPSSLPEQPAWLHPY